MAERRIHGMQLKLPNWRKTLAWCLWFLFILIISGLHISMTGRSTTPGRKSSKMVAATHSVKSLKRHIQHEQTPGKSGKFTVGLGANLAFEGPSIVFSMAEAQFLFRIFRGFGHSKIYKHCLTIFPLEKASVFFFYQSCFCPASGQALPKNRNYELALKICHVGAPIFSGLVDIFLARALAVWYSEITHIDADRLMMMMPLCSSWLMPMCATLLLHENCAGGWKQFWSSCNSGVFDWSIFDEQILTTEEVCAWSPEHLLEERCSRSVVADLSPFVLQKNLLKLGLHC